jgi:serine/threonine-protein kinase
MEALGDEGFSYQAVATAAPAGVQPPVPGVPVARPWLRDRRSWASLAAALALAAWGAWGWLRASEAPEAGVPTRAHVTGLSPVNPTGGRFAISPDGRWIAAGAFADGANHLFVRSAEDAEWRRLPNTQGATNPTFSPDGQTVAFGVVAAQIVKVPVTGGPALPVAAGDQPHWGLDDTIVYQSNGALYRVGSSGGEPDLLAESDTLFVSRPHLLPNGRGVVFGTGTATVSRIALLDLQSGEVRRLLPAGSHPRYVPTGHLIYGHADGALMGVPFDLETLQVTGSPVTLLPELVVAGNGASQFAASETGTLIYDASLAALGASRLVEVGLDGTETPLPTSAGQFDAPRYSPDGRRIAYHDRGVDELRIYDASTGATPQFASGGYPVWSTTGEHLYFSGPLTGPAIQDGFRRPADGSTGVEQLWSRPGGEMVADVSAGDSIIVVREDASGLGRNILLARLGGQDPVFEDFLTAEWNEINGEISPNGRWIAYQSDETGEYRVYVHSFPVITGRHSVSPGVGTDPIWSPEGDRIYYRTGGRVMAVEVVTEPDFAVSSAPVELFDRPEYTIWQNPGPQRTWDIHPDGSRFIVVKSEATPGADSGTYIVTNWFEELRQRMGN